MFFKINLKNLNEMLDQTANKYPNNLFLLYHNQKTTFLEFRDHVLRFANVLNFFKVKKGDFVGINVPNSLEFCIATFACYRIGAIATPFSVSWKVRELKEVIERTQMKHLITDSSLEPIIKASMKTENIQNIILVGKGKQDQEKGKIRGTFWYLSARVLAFDLEISLDQNDLASCHFTSGTSGLSKAVLHDHLGNLYKARVLAETFDFTPDDQVTQVLPMAHTYGFSQLITTIYVGNSLKLIDRLDPEILLHHFEDPNMTVFCGVPTIFNMLAEYEKLDSINISPNTRLFISGAGPLRPSTEQVMNDSLLREHGCMCQAYGSTEDNCCGTTNYRVPKYRSVGYPMKGVNLEIVNMQGIVLEYGKDNKGMIVNQGPHIMRGYLGLIKKGEVIDEIATSKVLKPIEDRKGRWYWSGDIGYRDLDGAIYIVDRVKDIAKVSERLVFPSEIEHTMMLHPAVKEISVINVPHKLYGEELVALIVPKDLNEDPKELETKLRFFAKENLAKYKVPRIWHVKSFLNKGPSGKVVKDWYRDEIIKKENRDKLRDWLLFNDP